jgi:predicted dehydrogenase
MTGERNGAFRVGVIGAGIHGTRYLRHARADVPGMRPVALCRRDRAAGEALARELGCRYEADPARLAAAGDVDGVIVVTPPDSHLDLARLVLSAGKPLLLEKPMTATLAQARELAHFEAERLSGSPRAGGSAAPPFMLAQTLRWNPVVRRVRELWPRLGAVHLVRITQRLEPTDLAWQRDPKVPGGGSVLLTGVHVFDLARFLTGREYVAVDSRQRGWKNPVWEDVFLARGELDDGTLVSLEVSKFGITRGGFLEAVGEEMSLVADYQFGGIRLIRGRDVEAIACDAAAPTLPRVLEAWMENVLDPAHPAPPVTAADGLRTLEVVEACYVSARERREVKIAEL